MMYSIDINADVGEGLNVENHLMPFISSCSIACGGHAGDLETMRNVVRLAKKHKVKIGAHPSFPDRENFGRKAVKMESSELAISIKEQILKLSGILEEEKLKMHHVKLHGALYNLAARDENLATLIIKVVKNLGFPVKLYVPYKSVIATMAQQKGLPIVYEAFADRNYDNNLKLVSRTFEKALITEPEKVFNHVFQMIKHNQVTTVSGQTMDIKASTFCIHGDNSNALEIAAYLNKKLTDNGIKIE